MTYELVVIPKTDQFPNTYRIARKIGKMTYAVWWEEGDPRTPEELIKELEVIIDIETSYEE